AREPALPSRRSGSVRHRRGRPLPCAAPGCALWVFHLSRKLIARNAMPSPARGRGCILAALARRRRPNGIDGMNDAVLSHRDIDALGARAETMIAELGAI